MLTLRSRRRRNRLKAAAERWTSRSSVFDCDSAPARPLNVGRLVGGGKLMTEEEWRAGSDPEPMVRALPPGKYERELRLFCVACVRRVSHLLPDACRRAVDLAEQFARGAASESELRAAFESAAAVIDEVWSGGRSPDARAYATQAVGDATAPYPPAPGKVLSATSEAASAVGCAAAEADDANYDVAFDAARAAELSWQAAHLRDLVPYPGGRAVR